MSEHNALQALGLPTTLQRVLQARGVHDETGLDLSLKRLYPAHHLKGLDDAVALLQQAIADQQQIVIVGDFDADGATSTALMVRALRAMGAQVQYIVPDRFKFGYGLTPAIVDLAVQHYHPDLIVTVDNGISSHEGVARAQALGVRVVITDHHLTTKAAPPADAVVNPNQQGCTFASKALAGVGVAFYVMAALASLRAKQGLPTCKVTDYLDLVALGTVADVAVLDHNNRILVHQGVLRIRAKQCSLGILALLHVAGKRAEVLEAIDLGFILGPRINAAGRMESMRIGIDCLLADDEPTARTLAEKLDALNHERRAVEQTMKQEAINTMDTVQLTAPPPAIVLYEPSWHQGVIGIVAGRLKERYYRPTIVFAPSEEGSVLLKGSARSIDGVHIRDVIERVANKYPHLVQHFGGHAMAAGLTLHADALADFKQHLEEEMQLYDAAVFNPTQHSDGELQHDEFSLSFVEVMQRMGPWGNGFIPPVFEGYFRLIKHKWLKEKHLKMTLQHKHSGQWLEAVYFNAEPSAHSLGAEVHVRYVLEQNEFNGRRSVQLNVKALAAL